MAQLVEVIPQSTSAQGQLRVYAIVAQPILSEGLAHVLEGVEDLRLIGSSETLAAAEELARIRPEVLVLDQGFGLRGVVDFLLGLRRSGFSGRVVLWTKDVSAADRSQALEAGVTGILDKSLPGTVMLECLRTVGSGRPWSGREGRTQAGEPCRGAARLTTREREIVALVQLGLKNKDIAARLGITPGTVKVHLMHIFEKTGAHDRVELGLEAERLLDGTRKDSLR
jgi:two-component system nitrate/nitrite response regulator NarL